MTSQQLQSEINPTTIFRHAYAVYPPMAMLAGMQLDVFTPLKDGPMSARALAHALGIRPERLQPLLYALVHAELLRVEGDRFVNTPEADVYLVRGRSTYMGTVHELYADLWATVLQTARSIRTGAPQAKHDFATMSDDELGAFFRGQHAGALAMGKQLAQTYGFERFRSLVDAGGGSGGVAIAACQCCPDLTATIIELPRVAPIARSFVHEAKLGNRLRVVTADIAERMPEGRFDAAVLRSVIQVLGPNEAARAIRNIGQAINADGAIFVVGHVLKDNRLSPTPAVAMNLVFLNIYDEGQAYTEGDHRTWLVEAGFSDIDVQYGAGRAGTSIVVAHKVG
jgi:hypothetical protein